MIDIAALAGAAIVGAVVAGLAVAAATARSRRTIRDELAVTRRDSQHRADQIAQVSHELRTPLAAIKAAAGILDEGRAGPVTEQQRRFFDVLVRQSDLVVSISEDLLLQSRIEAGVFRPQPAMADMGNLVRQTVFALRSLTDERGMRMICSVPRLSPRAWVDERLVSQALTNVLSNAIKHSARGEQITTVLGGDGEYVVISVTDGGAGMTPEERRTLFRRFVSAGVDRSAPPESSNFGASVGLGMALTRQIAELHGGRVLVDTAQRRGTTVMIVLPSSRPGPKVARGWRHRATASRREGRG